MLNCIKYLRSYLPTGGALPEDVWRRRHRFLIGLTWAHALAIALVGSVSGKLGTLSFQALFQEEAALHTIFEGGIVALFAFFGSWNRFGRTVRSVAVSFGLITSSAILVHLSGGYVELHFHFFVMLVFLALYQDWLPYLLAVAYVAVHHGLVGTLWPEQVFNHTAALNAPWTWGAIHAVFILWQCVGSIIAWRFTEKAVAQTRMILNSAGEGIYGLDRNGKVVFANPVAAEIFGLEEKEIVGSSIQAILSSRRADELCPIVPSYESLTAPPEGMTRLEGQEILRRADGTRFPVEYLSTAIIDRGERAGAVVSFRDVTERERAAEALRRSQKQYQDLVNTIDGIVWEADAENLRFTFVSPQAERILGYPAGRWIEEPDFWAGQIHPEDRDRAVLSCARAAAERGDIHRFEYRMIAADGRIVWLGNIVTVVSADDQSVKLRGVMIDITQRREAEERARGNLKQVRTLHDFSVAMSATLEVETLLEILMSKVAALLPYPAMLVWLRGKDGALERAACFNVGEDWKQKQLEEVPLLVRTTIEFQRPVASPDVQNDPRTLDPEFYRREGIVSYLSIPLIAKEDVLGTLVFLTREAHVFTRDEIDFLSTLGAQTAMALNNSRLFRQTRNQAAELEKVNRQINDFTAMMAHDLRSPLTTVIGVGQMMTDGYFGPVSDEQKRWLNKMLETSRGLADLVGDFLDVSKLEAGSIELAREDVGVEDFLRDVFDNHRLIAEERKISMAARVAPGVTAIAADRRRLEQVMNNLFSNALKFTPAGGAIEAGAELAGAEVKIWVKDTGSGIAPEEAGALFEKYRQTASGKKSKHKGTGLGLVICKMIVEAHGGKISVASEVGLGTTITFTIPFAGAAEPREAAGAQAEIAKPRAVDCAAA